MMYDIPLSNYEDVMTYGVNILGLDYEEVKKQLLVDKTNISSLHAGVAILRE